MFVDEVVVHVKAGDGGGGCCSFRREKFIPEGGPDGGNGGDGGSIIVIGSSSYNTLSKLKFHKHFIAKSGKSGSGRLKTGETGNDITIYVPLGTEIIDYNTNVVLYDITQDGQKLTLARGGRGGRGNATFKSSKNQAPRDTTPGTQGEAGMFIFRLKLFCDIGLIGFPNAGKSTLINSITNTKSIVGDYMFTTLKPVLGMLEMGYKQYVVSDIPGLIEGAWRNLGLGHKFLRHVERCSIIAHLIDINSSDLRKNYDIIRNELKKYNPAIAKKKEIIVFTQIDRLTQSELAQKEAEIKHFFPRKKYFLVSSFTTHGLEELKLQIATIIESKNQDKSDS